ncbi:hypothetical protein LEP1GSC137_1956 [Leptospira borgpetersenii str. Noumea 25]|nr:hypothetical protein LEP1GSC137_1956 [Leptospira borgpetersenii str. Noumea 25]
MKRILFTEFFPEENREKSVANPCQMLLETNVNLRNSPNWNGFVPRV